MFLPDCTHTALPKKEAIQIEEEEEEEDHHHDYNDNGQMDAYVNE